VSLYASCLAGHWLSWQPWYPLHACCSIWEWNDLLILHYVDCLIDDPTSPTVDGKVMSRVLLILRCSCQKDKTGAARYAVVTHDK